MKYNKINQILSLLTCFLMLLAVSIQRDQKIFGRDLSLGQDLTESADAAILSATAPLSDAATPSANASVPIAAASSAAASLSVAGSSSAASQDGGTIVINTSEIAKDIIGFGGSTPLEITVTDGIVTGVSALPNAESEEFFSALVSTGFITQWVGLSVDDALALEVDAVSGATFSSNAVKATFRRGLESIQGSGQKSGSAIGEVFTPKFICTIIVILMAAILPLFVHDKRYRIIQQILNVVVLGFWSGTFISYALLVSVISNGLNPLTSLAVLLLLVVAFVFPLFGRPGHYCAFICPMGSLQELCGKCVKRKLHISPKVVKVLGRFREYLWAVLMLCMWSGVLFGWMGYELFTAFLFRQASVTVICVAVAFVLLSLVVPRPYCHFVCPTGTLLRISQNKK